jgi:hypothetical protein
VFDVKHPGRRRDQFARESSDSAALAQGHAFTAVLTDSQRKALLENLKTL